MAIKLEKQEVAQLLPSIQKYFREELDQEICDMRAGFLLEYFLKEVGPLVYNRAVSDAERYFREKVEDLSGTCYEQGMTYWVDKQ